jgi:hypothetical protein
MSSSIASYVVGKLVALFWLSLEVVEVFLTLRVQERRRCDFGREYNIEKRLCLNRSFEVLKARFMSE